MKTSNFTIIKDQYDRFYFIPESEIERNEPVHDSYTNGRLVTASEADDYSIQNFDGTAPDDLRKAGAEIFGEKFLDLNWDFDMDGSFYFENLEELGLEDQEEDIRNFFAKWCDENESFTTADYYTYWDGHNNVSIILNYYDGDFTPEYEELDGFETAQIMKAFKQATEWENESAGIKVSYYGGYKFIESSCEGHIGNYEAVLLDADERIELAQNEGSYLADESTSERNGYPKNVKPALTGFDTFEEAQEMADKYGLQVSEFYSMDGWQLMYRNGAAFGPLEYKPEDFGDDYEFVSSEDIDIVLDKMRSQLEDCTTWEEAKEVFEAAEKIQESMDDLEDDQVLVVNGLNIHDTIFLHTMRKYLDSQSWVIGLEYVEK